MRFERSGIAVAPGIASRRRSSVVRLVAFAAMLLWLFDASAVVAPSAREAEAQARLAALRGEIRQLASEQQRIDGERHVANRELRDADQAIADAAAAIRTLDAERQAGEQELAALQVQRGAVQQQLDAQRDMLAGLLRSAYALGRHEHLKLLLAQADTQRTGRALAYQRYLQRDRMRRIESLIAHLAELARLESAIADAQQRLAATAAERQAAMAELQQQRDDQQRRVAELEGRFRDARSRLAALGRDESALLKLIEQLKDVFADIPRQLDGGQSLASQRGRLPRPLAGRIATAFGGTLPDGRRSSGWWIGGDAGANVQAIAHGRVAFADWMKGYGLLLIVDHGDGFMSLYAANESLLKGIGDWVRPGEPIATVGASGGQPLPGVYFELRQNGRPVDPARWLRAR